MTALFDPVPVTVDDPVLRCPSWCVLDPGHVAAELAELGPVVLHRGVESVVTCRSTEVAAPVHETVDVRVSRRWWIEFDEAAGEWVAEPEPTVHLSGLPDFPLRPADALALAATLAAAGTPGPRRG